MRRFFLFFCFIFAACFKKETPVATQIVRINLDGDPTTLDPRKARDLNSGILLRMMFEGLTRTSKLGKVEPALARSIEISEDGLQYVFYLHDTKWSNGDPLTALDFVASWKSILSPNFPTDTAYNLYSIKNAKAAKLGEVSPDAIGIRMLDPLTFVVDLERPIPYFLELLTMPTFFPVPEKVVSSNPNWSLEAATLVSNGPFKIKNWSHTDQISLQKNNLYWDAKSVHLDEICLVVASPDTSLRMFEEEKMDWAGSPLSTMPADAVKSLAAQKKLQFSPFLMTAFFRVNTLETIAGKFNPLSNVYLRRALCLALDRQSIVDHLLQGGQKAALCFVPPEMELSQERYFLDNQPEEALALLKQAGSFLGPLVISYANNERNATIAQAIQKQWQETLHIPVELEAIESKIYFQRVAKKEFQLAIGSWTADFNDPVNFLEVFKYKDNGTNNTGWENSEYIDLLNRSALCRDLEERKVLLQKAERCLMVDMPIIPIYHSALNYLKTDALKGAILSPQGHLDLRWAYLETPSLQKR